MGQRLNVEIWNDGEVLANAYYHWSAYTASSAVVVDKVLKFINENPIDNEDILLYAIRALEATGAGLNKDEIEYAAKMGINTEERAECVGRNSGLLSISQEGMQETRDWQEGAVYIYLDEKRISFNVFDKQRRWDWERGQREEYGNEKANARDLDVVYINFDDIKFSKWDSVFDILKNRDESFISHIDTYQVITPIR